MTNDPAAPCANCGRNNLPTTRFCAQCGEVVRTDPPRHSRKRRRRSRKRIHWVRVPNRPAPSIVAASAVKVADPRPARTMRRAGVALALTVAVIAIGAYAGYTVVGDSSDRWAASAAVSAPVAQAPMPALELPQRRDDTTAAPPPMPLAASRSLDVVPPRTPKAANRVDRASTGPSAPDDASLREHTDATAPAPSQVALALPVAAAPPAEPLQLLDETIADCARRGFLGRVACEQHALLRYCDGRWGHSERCPSGRTADYGN